MKEKIKDTTRTILIWILIWTIIEFFIPGDLSITSFTLYLGACLGYIAGVFMNGNKKERNYEN